MAGSAFVRLTQQDFSAGMFSSLAPELIPPNGCSDITNGLLNEQNVVFRRGGSSYYAASPAGGPVRMLWAGFLKHGGYQVILCTSSESFRVEPSGALVKIGLKPPAVLTTPTVFQGVLYVGTGAWDGETATVPGVPIFIATAANRLLRGEGNKVIVGTVPAKEGDAYTFPEANYFSLPEGVTITGMVGWRTSCVVFTTRGIWLLGGLARNITDELGNVQWSQDRYSVDAVLWGQPGVAAWRGGLVVPCKDDVWLMELGVSSEKAAPFRSISGAIQNLYRSYVQAGYTPGAATVYNGHYFLPILNGNSVVDLLVCRLEGANSQGRAEPAWTHLTGYGAQVVALTSLVSDLEGPLIGATAGVSRVLKLGYFTPGTAFAKDADGTDPAFSVTTRSVPTGNLTPNTVAKARLSYRLVAGPATTMTVGFGSTPYGAEWDEANWDEAEWGTAVGPFTDLGASIPPAKADPTALVPKTWRVGKKVRYARVRIALSGPASECSIRMLELAVRPDGRVF